jgi:hypothetical protein
LFDGAHVLVFATQDKGSGMSHYEVREGYFGWFTKAESPYQLRDQELRKKVYIKAVDNHGNERLVTIAATHPIPMWHYTVYTLVTLIIITAILYVTKKIWRRR